MGIVDEDIARVRDATDLVRIVSEHLQLRKVGRRWVGLCPFHNEKSPSFNVNQELGYFMCFGCQKSGDAITFVRELEGLDFVGAVERLAGKCGVVLRYTSRDEGAHRQKRKALIAAVDHAVEFYHQRLLEAPDAGPARSYLRDRGITGEEARAYKIGWAPDDWDVLANYLTRRFKVSRKDLDEAGLAFVNKRNRLQDSFRARILFPIYDANGDPVGFGGRKMPDGDGPKYKNSQESPIYAKSRLLYGLNWAKENIVQHDEAIICEGYTDVIGFAQAGVPRAVATCGTALTEDHLKVLKRFAKRVVLAFDADAAGQAAAERFYEWEKEYEIDVRVAAMPNGVDPADLARSDPEALQASVSEAQPFLAFRVQRALNTGDLTTAEGRARAAEAATDMVAEHPNPLVRDQYLMEIAGRCQLDVAQLRTLAEGSGERRKKAAAEAARQEAQRQSRQESRQQAQTGNAPDQYDEPQFHEAEPYEYYGEDMGQAVPNHEPEDIEVDLTDTVEVQMLRLAVHFPEEIPDLITEDLFANARNRNVFTTLLTATTLQEAIDAADPGAAQLLRRLIVEEPDENDRTHADQLAGRMVDEAATRELKRLEAEVRSTGDLTIGRSVAALHSALVDLRNGGWKLEHAAPLAAQIRQRHIAPSDEGRVA